jgi:hypothetical protein
MSYIILAAQHPLSFILCELLFFYEKINYYIFFTMQLILPYLFKFKKLKFTKFVKVMRVDLPLSKQLI